MSVWLSQLSACTEIAEFDNYVFLPALFIARLIYIARYV